MTHIACLLSAATLVLGFAQATLAQTWPAKPVRLVVPYGPGGSTDIAARKYAARMSTALGQSMVVENKAGADAAIGAADVAHAAPDGYSVLFGTLSTHVITPALLKDVNYDPVKDFAQVAIYGAQPLTIVANTTIPQRTLGELIAFVKANPGKYAYVSSSSIGRLAALLFARQAGNLDMVEVGYKGAAAGIPDLLANRVQIYTATPSSVAALVKSNSLRVLAVMFERRVSIMPDVPTTAEAGLPDLVLSTYNVIAVPAATPKPVIARLASVTGRVGADPAHQKELESTGLEILIEADPAKADAYVKRSRALLAPVLNSF
jgi:tripartite-type tricarboxylate transporter receptor subunit TctC